MTTPVSVKDIDIYIREAIPRLERLIEASAAKIIKDISEEIRKCDGTIKQLEETNKQIVLGKDKEDKEERKPSGLHKYSYPNYRVGNESLGSSKDPKSLKWPFGQTE